MSSLLATHMPLDPTTERGAAVQLHHLRAGPRYCLL